MNRALLSMVLSCLSFSCASAFVNFAYIVDPSFSPLFSSFMRSVVNMGALIFIAAARGDLRVLIGDRRASLWLRGVFGTVALITSFYAIKYIGMSESAFLTSSSSVFVAFLGPIVLRQRTTWPTWFMIFFAFVGLYLLLQPRIGDIHPYGRFIAVSSGFASALAYLMIAKVGKSNSPISIIFSFVAISTVVHLFYLMFASIAWPASGKIWLLLVLAGLCGTSGQFFLTYSYQNALAAKNAAVSFLTPVFSFIFGILLFEQQPDRLACIGAAIIVVSGAILPFLGARGRLKNA
jgi:drug/metabolite transporter (DMT)-like permease